METPERSPSQQAAAYGADRLSQQPPAGDKIAHPTGPYLSVVVTARNDDHGGNLLGRMQAFVNGWIEQCRRHRLQAELIIVEWNPLPDRPPLADVLAWPDAGGFCDVRIIEVPPEIHQSFRNWQAMPLYQMIGKNVGIRRARGEFVLATNIDILFSDELVSFFAERRLEPGKMYRVNRWDVMADVPVNAGVEEQLAYCQSHLIRLNAREGTFRLGTDGVRVLEENDIASLTGAVKLGAGWFQREMSGEEPFRWVDNDAELIISPPKISPAHSSGANQARVLALDIEPGPGVNMSPFLLELRDAAGKHLSEILVKRRSVVTFALPHSEGEEVRVVLHTRDGGNRIRSDLRTLNFRLFRCKVKLVSSSSPNPEPAIETVAASLNTTESWGSRMGRGLRLVREIWRGNPDVQIRVPMSRDQLAKLQLKQDGSGVSFSARALKRPRGTGDASLDILPAGMRAVWGAGWYPVESFHAETFRWMERNSAVVWLPPRQLAGELVLHVEPGPAVGFKTCQMEIRDQWDEIVDVQEIRGRSAIRIPVEHLSGPFITSFAVLGGGPPKKVAGDSRVLALRVFGCTWEGTESDQADYAAELVAAGAGIWSGRGWLPFDTRQGAKGLAALRDAELILRTPDGPNRSLTLEVSPGPGARPLDLLIEDSRGRIMYRGKVSGPRQVQLKNVFRGGNFYALRLRDAAHEDNPTPPRDPMLFVPAILWKSTGENAGENQTGDDCIRVVLHQSASDQAIQLHTNACGDFTLLARERWMDLRAYPELDLFSMNIDSIFCWMAHHGGAREEMLEDPMRIYHIEHGTGSGWTPEGEKKLFERIAAKGLSWVDYHDVVEWARIMNRFDAPMIFNREGWGLATAELKEFAPGTRRSAAPVR
jgi:hypothetical protein